jgi:hypothetical protein
MNVDHPPASMFQVGHDEPPVMPAKSAAEASGRDNGPAPAAGQ